MHIDWCLFDFGLNLPAMEFRDACENMVLFSATS